MARSLKVRAESAPLVPFAHGRLPKGPPVLAAVEVDRPASQEFAEVLLTLHPAEASRCRRCGECNARVLTPALAVCLLVLEDGS